MPDIVLTDDAKLDIARQALLTLETQRYREQLDPAGFPSNSATGPDGQPLTLDARIAAVTKEIKALEKKVKSDG